MGAVLGSGSEEERAGRKAQSRERKPLGASCHPHDHGQTQDIQSPQGASGVTRKLRLGLRMSG